MRLIGTSLLAVVATLVPASGVVAQENEPAETPTTEAGAATEASSGGLQVGAAKVEITPPADPAFPAVGEFEHERLYLRAVVLDNGETKAVLIGADLGGINEDVWADASQQIADELGIPVANIIMTPTHTHSDNPAGFYAPEGTPRYGSDFVAERSVEVVRQAVADLAPARVGYSTGEVDLNVNRDAIDRETRLWTQAANFEAPADKTVGVLSFIGEDGRPIAAYFNYGMHPVSGYLAGFVSGDFAGEATRYVEQAFGDDMVAVFSQNASGNLNPRWLRTGTNAIASRSGMEIHGFEEVRETIEAPLRDKEVEATVTDPEVARQLANYMESVGVILGEEVIRVMSHTEGLQDDPQIWGLQTTLTCPGRTRLDNAREGVAGQYEQGDDVDIRLGVLGIGDTAVVTTNGEVYTEIGQRVLAESPLAKTMYVTLANGRAASGYIPDDSSFGHQTFQVLGSRLLPGCAEEGIVDGLTGLVAEYMAQ